jgi:hypothetical protein
MRFLLSDLQQAQFPDAIANGRHIFFPKGHGTIEQCDGVFFRVGDDMGMNLQYWVLFRGEFVPIDQIEIALEPNSTRREALSERAVELFNLNQDMTVSGLQRAMQQASEPHRVPAPKGCDEFLQYFQRHEPFCHELRALEPDVMWRTFYRGAIPDHFQGFESDYTIVMTSKMMCYQPADLMIQPPPEPFVWMADYARRKSADDVTSTREGSAVYTRLLALPSVTGPIVPRYRQDVMRLLMANPDRQTTALVLFALTDGVSAVWSKPSGFDQWLLSACVAP